MFAVGDLVELNVDKNLAILSNIDELTMYINELDTPVETIYNSIYLTKGTLLKVVAVDTLTNTLLVAPVNQELVSNLKRANVTVFEVESTYVDAASSAATILYRNN